MRSAARPRQQAGRHSGHLAFVNFVRGRSFTTADPCADIAENGRRDIAKTVLSGFIDGEYMRRSNTKRDIAKTVLFIDRGYRRRSNFPIALASSLPCVFILLLLLILLVLLLLPAAVQPTAA